DLTSLNLSITLVKISASFPVNIDVIADQIEEKNDLTPLKIDMMKSDTVVNITTITSCITVTAVVKINCIAIHKAEKNVFILSQTDTKKSTVAVHDSFKTSQIAIPDSLIASHRSMKNSLIGSQYLITKIAAAIIAITTREIGEVNIAIAVPIPLTTFTTINNPEIIFGINPISNINGPAIKANTAVMAAPIAINCLVPSLNPLNQSAIFCSHSVNSLTNGNKADPIEIATSSKADARFSIPPFKLSFIVSRISLSAPSDSFILTFKSSYSPFNP